MATRILFIRHPATDVNGRLCGSFDIPLAPDGRAHLEAVLRRGVTHPAPDALYTSTLTRAMDAALELGRTWGLQPRMAEWAREIHCGDVEGMPLDRLQRQYPELWVRNQAQDDEAFAWPGGESYRDFRARVLAGLTAAAAAHSGQRVAIVTHTGVVSQVLGVIRHRPAAVWAVDRPDPFTATEVEWVDNAPTAIVAFNSSEWY